MCSVTIMCSLPHKRFRKLPEPARKLPERSRNLPVMFRKLPEPSRKLPGNF